MDDQRYEQYCRKKISHDFFLQRERERQAMEDAPKPAIAGIVSIAKSVLALTAQGIKKIAARTCRMRLAQLLSTKKYIGPIRKQIQEVIGAQKDLALEQKEKLANFIDEIINQTAVA